MKKLTLEKIKASHYVLTWLFLLIGLVANSQQVKKALIPKNNETISKAGLNTVLIPVEGMSCGSCASHVKKSVKFLQGVNNVEVSLEKRQAKVSYFPQKISATKIQEAISASGYKAGKPVVQKDK